MRWVGLVLCLALPASAFPDPLMASIRQVVPPGVTVVRVDRLLNGARVIGSGARHEDVAALMQALSTLVQTPEGVRRVVERRPGLVRVAMPGADGGTLIDVAEKDAVAWKVTLTRAASPKKKGGAVAFDITLGPP